MNQGLFIAVDWGVSRLRAYLLDRNGPSQYVLLDSKKGKGVSFVENRFHEELFEQIQPWLNKYGSLPIIMSGHISSNVGWKPTPYIQCPVSVTETYQHAITDSIKGCPLYIMPGISYQQDGNMDVMRGEEVQILGWSILHQPQEKVRFCLPGSHTKWVVVDNQQITAIHTALTGELFALLSRESVLLQDSEESFCTPQFVVAVDARMSDHAKGLTHALFQVRTKQLLDGMTKAEASDYLSGMLIGDDVKSAMQNDSFSGGDTPWVVIGETVLQQRFSVALSMFNQTHRVSCTEHATLTGFNYLASALVFEEQSQPSQSISGL